MVREELAAKFGIGPGDIHGMHCFEPAFLERQVDLSRRNLSLDTIDLLYLHNPEVLRNSLGYQAVLAKVEKAFEKLEELRSRGKINYYGVSSFAGFRVGSSDASFIGLQDLKRAAERVGGRSNGFQYISTPLNVAMMEPLLEKNQPKTAEGKNEVELKSALKLASELQLNVMTTSPFMSGFLHQVPLPTAVMKSRYLAVKHLNLIR